MPVHELPKPPKQDTGTKAVGGRHPTPANCPY